MIGEQRRRSAPGSRKHFSGPSGESWYWWHTADDTFDKIDFDVLRRDTRVTLALLLGFVGESSLPADFSEYFQMWDGYLQAMEESEEHQEAVNEVRTLIAQLAKLCTEPEASSQEKEHNRLCRLVGGTVTRLMHMSGSPYEQDTSFAYGPLHLFAASCRSLSLCPIRSLTGQSREWKR